MHKVKALSAIRLEAGHKQHNAKKNESLQRSGHPVLFFFKGTASPNAGTRERMSAMFQTLRRQNVRPERVRAG